MFHFYNGVPKEFATGKKVKDRSRTSMDGLKVQNLTEMKGGTGARQEHFSAAPVAGAERGSAVACTDPVIVNLKFPDTWPAYFPVRI